MRIFRRRAKTMASDEPRTGAEVAVRTERALIAVAVYAQQLEQRLDRLEHRLDERRDGDESSFATLTDLLEVHLHSARVAAELSMVTVQLRAEIDELATKGPTVTPQQARATALAEVIIDLSDGLDTQPIDLSDTPTDWAATA